MAIYPLKFFLGLLFSVSLVYANINFDKSQKTLQISVSGQGGSSGSGGYGYSRNGTDGENGQPGGDVSLSLSYADTAKTQVRVQVQVSRFAINHSQVYSLAELKNIVIYANGGHGGDGGQGSNGDDGRDGYDGMDGCPPSSGSSGSSGDDGGHGGNGGNGGQGGDVKIFVPDNQSELLMLVKSIENRGGYSGSGGNGGRGGDGGDGGDGGRNTCEQGGLDASDGSDGWDGSNGRSGSGGYSGSKGNLRYVVTLPGGESRSYAEKYNLKIQKLEYADENNDGLIEYGEKISITKIQFLNSSEMPTPKDFFISGQTNLIPHWIWIKSNPSQLLRSLAPNESTQLTFPVGHLLLQAMDIKDFVDINTRIPIGFYKDQLVGAFEFLPSANIKRVAVLESQQPEEKLFWKQTKVLSLSLDNRSNLNVGRQSYRPLTLEVQLKSSIVRNQDLKLQYGGKDFLFDAQNTALVELENLKPGKNQLNISLVIGQREDLFTSSQLVFKLRHDITKKTIDDQVTNLEVAKDLIDESYVFPLKLTEKFYCEFGPKPKYQKRRLKEIMITKAAGSPNVELNMVLAKFILFSQKVPKFTNSRHEFAKYLQDLKSNQLTGQKFVSFLNSYAKTGTINSFKQPKEKQWLINECTQKVKNKK